MAKIFSALVAGAMALSLAAVCGCSSEDSAGSGGTGGQTDGRKPLDPTLIPKFQTALVVPPVMPSEGVANGTVSYRIAARQFEQQMLPDTLPKTTVWGYGRASDPSTLHTPSFTLEARSNQKMRIEWVNGLVDDKGHYLAHLLPVDQTLHWANPAGPPDMEGKLLEPYLGPVPIVTHVHGAHVPTQSDGNPRSWYLPDASDIPAGYSTRGTNYGSAESVAQGSAVFEYPNDRRAETLWFHDHALGITRLNVYAGLAGFLLVRDDEEAALGLPGPSPKPGDAAGTRYYEIPIAIQDRSFHVDGSLAYPASRSEFDGYKGPFVPDAPVNPIWNPEAFGNTIVVNGNTWPYLEIEPRLYRLRLLNGCNARTLRLKFDRALSFVQIGAEGGFLADAPVVADELLLAPAERADVIVDFGKLAPGDTLHLVNIGPDEPYQGPDAEQSPADPATTGQVMELRVIAKTTNGIAGSIPTTLPAIEPLSTTLPQRDLTLNEVAYGPDDMPVEAKLGTASKGGLGWDEAITETPKLGDTEIWRFFNLTADAHPVHLHLVMFQVLDRTPFDDEAYKTAQNDFLAGKGPQPKVEDYFSGAAIPALPHEHALKDTVIANPHQITRIIANFDVAGLYVWHCHILEHEDNEMMRPFQVLAP